MKKDHINTRFQVIYACNLHLDNFHTEKNCNTQICSSSNCLQFQANIVLSQSCIFQVLSVENNEPTHTISIKLPRE